MSKRKKRQRHKYWTKIQEYAVSAYIQLDPDYDKGKRDKIYNRFLKTPVDTMIQKIIGRYKFKIQDTDPQELVQMCLIHVLMSLDKVDFERGRAFSFLSTVVRNFLIHTCTKSYTRAINTVYFMGDDSTSDSSDEEYLGQVDSLDTVYDNFVDEFVEESPTDLYLDRIDWLIEKSGSHFSETDMKVLVCIRNVLDDHLFDFRFKGEFLNYIRDEVNTSSTHVDKLITKIKKIEHKIDVWSKPR